MKKAAKLLVGRHDFKVFCASRSQVKDTKRIVKRINIRKIKELGIELISIEITADGFLYNMVRNIAGTLVDIGRGRFDSQYIIKLINSKNRNLAGPCLPARGLFLEKVKY